MYIATTSYRVYNNSISVTIKTAFLEYINQNQQYTGYNQIKSPIILCVAGFVLLILIIVVMNIMTRQFIVDGFSMSPALESGQYLAVNRLAYQSNLPERGDLVVFRSLETSGRDVVKRVIALPGETVEFRSAQVHINGELLDEPYLLEPCDSNNCPDSIWQLGEDEYFVMGDNRNHSSDSRFFGAIDADIIIGEVMLRYFPFSEFGYPD